MLLEQISGGGIARVVRVGGRPGQQRGAFVGRQDVQPGQGRLRRLLQRIDQAQQRAFHQGADAVRVEAGIHLRAQPQPLAEVIHRQPERVVGAPVAAQQGEPVRQSVRWVHVCAVAVVEQGREQWHRRRHRAAPLRQTERRVLVAHQLEKPLLCLAQGLGHGPRIARDAQRQGVDEHAQRALHPRTALHPPEQHRAEHHIVLTATTRQHQRPRQMAQSRRRRAAAARLGSQPLGQRWRQLARRPDGGRTIALHIRQPERRGGGLHITEHVAEKRLVRLGWHAARLRHEVAERQRWRQRRSSAALHVQHDLVQQRIQGGVVRNQVMADVHHQHALTIGRHKDALQRGSGDVEIKVTRVAMLEQLIGHRASGWVEVQRLDRQLHLAPNHLQRLGQLRPHHGGAQNVVPGDHRAQGVDERMTARR